MRCLGHCEIDKYADLSYRAIHDVKEGEFFAADIRAIAPWDLPNADCYAFGFPCQPWSSSGKRKAFDDIRGTLIFEVLRLVAARKPPILFAENVAGILTIAGGRVFGRILDAMGELGYFIEWQLINSAAYLPQSRARVYIVGHYGAPPARAVFPFALSDAEPRLIPAGWVNSQSRFRQANTIYSAKGISPCLDTSADRPKILLPDGRVRFLSALEKFRLQGFSDAAYGQAAAVNSEAQLQKQMGNSVSVPVIAAIGQKIIETQGEQQQICSQE
jgi:DNA (cytosine-5)-methyltransferase 1